MLCIKNCSQPNYLKATEAGSSGQGDVADVGWVVAGHGLIDDEGPVLQVGAAGLLHLPKILKSLNHID